MSDAAATLDNHTAAPAPVGASSQVSGFTGNDLLHLAAGFPVTSTCELQDWKRMPTVFNMRTGSQESSVLAAAAVISVKDTSTPVPTFATVVVSVAAPEGTPRLFVHCGDQFLEREKLGKDKIDQRIAKAIQPYPMSKQGELAVELEKTAGSQPTNTTKIGHFWTSFRSDPQSGGCDHVRTALRTLHARSELASVIDTLCGDYERMTGVSATHLTPGGIPAAPPATPAAPAAPASVPAPSAPAAPAAPAIGSHPAAPGTPAAPAGAPADPTGSPISPTASIFGLKGGRANPNVTKMAGAAPAAAPGGAAGLALHATSARAAEIAAQRQALVKDLALRSRLHALILNTVFNKPVLLTGPQGTGKSHFADEIANSGLFDVVKKFKCSMHMKDGHLFGRQVAEPWKQPDGRIDQTFPYRESRIIEGAYEASQGKKVALLIEEAGQLPPEVSVIFKLLFDRRRGDPHYYFDVPSGSGSLNDRMHATETTLKVRRENLVVIATGNFGPQCINQGWDGPTLDRFEVVPLTNDHERTKRIAVNEMRTRGWSESSRKGFETWFEFMRKQHEEDQRLPHPVNLRTVMEAIEDSATEGEFPNRLSVKMDKWVEKDGLSGEEWNIEQVATVLTGLREAFGIHDRTWKGWLP